MIDVVIVGQGLAGTVLAWTLRPRRVLVIDREDSVTSSKIAAGLMTPITGKRLAVSPRLGDEWRVAVAFYRRIEAETGGRFFHEGPAVRIFADTSERELFEKRSFSGSWLQRHMYGILIPMNFSAHRPKMQQAARSGWLARGAFASGAGRWRRSFRRSRSGPAREIYCLSGQRSL